MKARIKAALKDAGIVPNRPNRKQGKTLPLCDCKNTKRDHYNNALGHSYRGNNNFKNNLSVKESSNG